MSGILRTIEVGGEQFDLGSDFHQGTEGQFSVIPIDAARELSRELLSAQQSEHLLLPGDLFHSESAKNWRQCINVSQQTNELLTLLARAYRTVLYVPGNHCLRRTEQTENPWDTLDPPKNVLMPRGLTPVVERVGQCRVLLANLFYDGAFIPGHPISDADEFKSLVASTTDGTSLLRGADSVPLFRDMTNAAASALTPDIDLLLTHVPPHPSSVRWRVYGEGDPSLPEGFPGSTVADVDEDARIAAYWKSSPEWVRDRINAKSAMLGSNVFREELGAKPRDGLVAAYGHHHRDEDRIGIVEGGNTVRFIAHQRMQWKRA